MTVLFFIVPGWSNPGQWRCYPAYRRDNEPIVPGSGHCPGFWILNNPNCTAFQFTNIVPPAYATRPHNGCECGNNNARQKEY